MSELKNRFIAWLRAQAIRWFGEPVARRGFTANQVTVVGALIFAGGFMIWMFNHQSRWGLLVAVIGASGDFWDGAVAKAPSGCMTRFGKVLDSWSDRMVEGAVWGAIGWVCIQQHHPVVAFGCFTALTGSFLVTHSRGLGEGAGIKKDKSHGIKGMEDIGLGDRFVRLVLIGVGVIVGPWIGYAILVLVINALAWQTAIQRLFYIRLRLEHRVRLFTNFEFGLVILAVAAFVGTIYAVAKVQPNWLIWS